MLSSERCERLQEYKTQKFKEQSGRIKRLGGDLSWIGQALVQVGTAWNRWENNPVSGSFL
jgi:hypothetical protein